MELLIEILGAIAELIFEAAYSCIPNPKLPKPARITLFLLLFGISIAIILFCLYIALTSTLPAVAKFVFLGVGLLFFAFLWKLVRQLKKGNKQ